MAKITLLLLLLPSLVISQVTNISHHDNDSISFSYSKKIYQEIAYDSIKRLYNDQYNYYGKEGVAAYVYPVSTLYKWEELSLLSIPYFRLARRANKEYDCERNIESFIEFEERNKYQNVIVMAKEVALTSVLIPDLSFEVERIFNPGDATRVDGSVYKAMLQSFQATPQYFKNYTDILEGRKEHFFFGIYGLRGVLFEIDSKTGLLYANKMDWKVERLLANDYLRKYEGELKIRELARGYYEDIDSIGTLDGVPCENAEAIGNNLLFKVKKVD